jgi:YidC/Oxa1 family membrane protein insertase
MNLLIAPFINLLFAVYYLVGNFGLSIILVTILLKLFLWPIIAPSLKSAKKINELQPKIKLLADKYGKDKQALGVAQMELYKKEGVNPMSGCLPQILQIAVLMLFYYAFNKVSDFSIGKVGREVINSNLIQSFRIDESFKFDLAFLGSELSQSPAKLFNQGFGIHLLLPMLLLLGSGLLQFLTAKVMMPAPKVSEAIADTTKEKGDDMMAAMRTQSTIMMPLMTIFIGWNFSIGILLYWFTNSALMVAQQLLVNKINKK